MNPVLVYSSSSFTVSSTENDEIQSIRIPPSHQIRHLVKVIDGSGKQTTELIIICILQFAPNNSWWCSWEETWPGEIIIPRMLTGLDPLGAWEGYSESKYVKASIDLVFSVRMLHGVLLSALSSVWYLLLTTISSLVCEWLLSCYYFYDFCIASRFWTILINHKMVVIKLRLSE